MHFDPRDFELLEMDTDSFYMGLSRDGMETLERLRAEEQGRETPIWIPRRVWDEDKN